MSVCLNKDGSGKTTGVEYLLRCRRSETILTFFSKLKVAGQSVRKMLKSQAM